jgi:hypothetical protein
MQCGDRDSPLWKVDVMIVHNVLLGIHVTAGSIGLLLGPVAMRQDSRGFIAAHRDTSRASGAYRAVVLLVCLSAVALVIEHRNDLWWLIPVSALTYGLAVLARASARRRYTGWLHGYVHGQGGSYIALWTALIVVALTVDGPVTGTAQLLPWLAPAALGTILIEIWRRKLDLHIQSNAQPAAPVGGRKSFGDKITCN